MQKYRRDSSVKIKFIKIKPCGGNGESYASIMFRVEIVYESLEKGSYIVKTLPANELAIEKLGMGSYDVQNKEMDIYKRILPELKKILKYIKEDKHVFPKALAVDINNEVIILEDLAEKNFVMPDRKKGLDMIHLKMGLDKLARLHASSLILAEKDNHIFDKFDVGMISRTTSAFHCFFLSNMEALVQEVLEWPNFEKYAKKLDEMKETVLEKAFQVFDNNEGELKVLCHGDLWTNNLMYTYDDAGNPTDVILIDFQFCYYGHPAIDVLYFLHTSAVDELRQNNIDELIQYYYHQLRDILIKLNYDMNKFPSLIEFERQISNKYFYAFPSTLLILPVMMSEDFDSCFENIHQVNERALAFKRRIYKNTNLQSIIKNILPKFDVKGLLEPI
ncbi:unnamed protein product [Diamesa hyperborea]